MRFIDVCLLNLVSRPLRTLLTLLGIAVATGSFFALVGASRGFERACLGSLNDRGTHVVGVRKGVVDFLSGSIDQKVGDRIREFDGVAEVAVELLDVAVLEPEETVLISGWRPAEYIWRTVRLRSGAMPSGGEADGIVIGEATAEALGKKVGDTVTIRDREFRISGVSQYGGAMNRTVVVMNLATMQKLMEREGKVTFLNLRLREPQDSAALERLREQAAGPFPYLKFCDTGEIVENDQFLRLFRATTRSTSFIALFMGLVVILNTLMMSVTERTYDIGVLSAIGWQPRRILSMILVEGVLLAVVGTGLGLLLGLGLLEFLSGLPQVRGFLEPEITTALLVEVSAAALTMGIVGSIYPAWRAVRLNPVDALRRE